MKKHSLYNMTREEVETLVLDCYDIIDEIVIKIDCMPISLGDFLGNQTWGKLKSLPALKERQ